MEEKESEERGLYKGVVKFKKKNRRRGRIYRNKTEEG